MNAIATAISLLKYGQTEAGVGVRTVNSIATVINLLLYGQTVHESGGWTVQDSQTGE